MKVFAPWADLAAMNDNGYVLWATPGASAPYWAAQASFSADVRLATPHDFESAGIEWGREDEDFEQEYEVEVELP